MRIDNRIIITQDSKPCRLDRGQHTFIKNYAREQGINIGEALYYLVYAGLCHAYNLVIPPDPFALRESLYRKQMEERKKKKRKKRIHPLAREIARHLSQKKLP
ncbi:hypothetical protein ACFLTS_03675 [Chloroflexota bacterium]